MKAGQGAAAIAGAVVALVGCLALLGWAVDVETLKSVSPSFTEMKANTAFTFVLAGASLLLWRRRRSSIAARALAGAVTAVGLLTLSEHIVGWNLGIDQLLFDDPASAVATPAPGRMGVNTAFCFTIAGLALLSLDLQRPKVTFIQIGSVVVATVSFTAFLGYVFGVPRLETGFVTKSVTPMALHTALTFMVLAAGLMLARPERGLVALARSDGAGGDLIRRLLLPAVVVPVVLGFLRLEGERAGLYGTEEGVVLFATSVVIVLGVLIWATARSLERADAKRRESDARKSAILDTAVDCVITIDHDGRILDFNPTAVATFGYEQCDAVGKRMADLIVPPSLREQHYAGFARHIETGESTIMGTRLELSAMRADGSEFPAELTITRGDLGRRPFFTGYLRDISERKRAAQERANLETQLRQSQKMEAIGRLAGGIAHDFNNVLTVIVGNSELLLSGLDDHDPRRGEVEEIRDAGEMASSLTRQLLAFSRRQSLEPRPLDLNRVVSGIVPMLGRTLGEGVELVAHLDPEVTPVLADPSQIDQVIVNLAVNARDAMPDGGTVTIETSNTELDEEYTARHASVALSPGRYVVLSMTDTGTGIDRETQAQIFDPFFTTKAAGQGTGLGLSTVYGIARQSGGSAWVYSEPGFGATFKVYLPVAETIAGDTPPPPTAGQPDEDERAWETVLLVEDEDSVRRLVRRILESRGYSVIEAADGGEALRSCERHGGEIHLAITDTVMPAVSGPELGVRLLALRPDMKLLYMSGYGERMLEELNLSPADAAFIQKPFTAAALAEKARRLLDAS